MSFKVDFSKFKKLSSDKKSTTLIHDDGHELKIAHNSLSAKMRSQLAKLPDHEDGEKLAKGGYVEKNKDALMAKHAKEKTSPKMEPIKMAEGGPAIDKNKAAQMQKGATESGFQPEQWKANAKAALGLAKGGEVNDEGRQLGAHHGAEGQGYSDSQPPKDPISKEVREFNTPTKPGKKFQENQDKKWQGKNILGLAEGGAVEANSENQQGALKEGTPEKKKQDQYGAFDELVGHFHRVGRQILEGGGSYAEGGQVQDPIQSELPKDNLMADLDKIASGNQQTDMALGEVERAPAATPVAAYESPSQAKGMMANPATGEQMAHVNPDGTQASPPMGEQPAPEAPVPSAQPLRMPSAEEMPVDALAVQKALGAQSDGIPSIDKLARDEAGAIRAEYRGQMAINHANQHFMDDQLIKQKEVDDTFRAKEKTLNDSIDSLSKQVADGTINPNRIFEGPNAKSKITTAIGLILGGLGAGLAHGENEALKTLNTLIDRDVDAQKANMQNKHNLLSESVRMMGNLRDGQRFASVQLADLTAKQMMAQANKLSDPILKAQMTQKVSEFIKPYAIEKQKLAAQAAVNTLENQAKRDPGKMGTYLEALKRTDPKQYEHMLGRAVPGMGFANTDKDASIMKELNGSVNGAKSSIKELMGMISQSGKSLSPEQAAKANTLQQTLIGQLRTAILGPGTINEGERAMMQNIIANPTKFFTLDNSNKVRLQTLMHTLDTKTKAAAESVGLQLRPSNEEQQKIRIAQANPNHPKAQMFLQLMQQKYGR